MGLVLQNEEIKQIHQNSLEILNDVGVRIDNEPVLQRLADKGCIIDFGNNTAKIPEKVVQECLSLCPSTIKICGRNNKTVEIGPDGGSVFWSGNALYIVKGDKRDEITQRDFADLTAVYDGLPNIDGVVGVSLTDVPPKVRDIAGFRIMAENTGKHLRPCIYCPENAEAIHEMADIMLDGKDYGEHPIYSLGYSICSPLHWTDAAVKLFSFSAGHSVPVTINSEIMLGGSSPVTIAGGIALGNAEVLSGIVINQILEGGRPVIYNLGFSHVLDMRTAAALSGCPECGLMAAAGAEMAHYYKLPSAAWMSTDSLSTDSQASFEHMLLLTAYLTSGINVIWGAGQIERQLSLSREQAVIDDEIISYVKRYVRGFEVTPETLALDVIKKVGINGEFLTEEHTMNHFKDELKMSELAMRNRRETLSQPEDVYMEKRAENYADNILKQEKVSMPDEQKREIQKVENAWLKKYGY